VTAGDVVGYVGNTGNARTTAPHLHFGLYDRGAIDPSPFLRMDEETPDPATGSPDALGTLVRVSGARVTLRTGAHGDADTVRQLEPGTLARVSGLVASSLRLSLPDRTMGYVPRQSVVPGGAATARILLATGAALLESPNDRAPVVHSVAAPTRMDLLGVFDGFEYVRMDERVSGWIRRAPRS
jgi:hypothetical protein